LTFENQELFLFFTEGVLIKPFSSEAAPFSFYFYPSGLLPGLVVVGTKPPHRATAKISRRQAATGKIPRPLRHFSLPLAPRRAVGRSLEPPDEAAGARVAYDHLCARRRAPLPAERVRFGLKPRSARGNCVLLGSLFLSWMETPAFLFLALGFHRIGPRSMPGTCSWSPKFQCRSARVLALFIWAFFLGY